MSERKGRKAYAYESPPRHVNIPNSYETREPVQIPKTTPSNLLSSLEVKPLENPPPILQLPVELLQDITRYLPVHAKVLLSLTCKNVLFLLGNQAWTDPLILGYPGITTVHPRNRAAQYEIPDRVTFLKILARDAPNLSYCANCKVLHPDLPIPEDLVLKKTGESSCLISKGVVDWFPRSQDGKGYTLVWDHVHKALDLHGAKILETSVMNAKYTLHQTRMKRTTTCEITLGAESVKLNMIFRHSHKFSITAGTIVAEDVLDFPLRICPHLTTGTNSWGGNDYVRNAYWDHKGRKLFRKTRWDNSPLLTHAINTAFPRSRQYTENLVKRTFREPYAREESQMTAKRGPQDHWWCRSCSTKFCVTVDENTLLINVYHNLGYSEGMARTNFEYLCRTDGMNWEFGSLSRTFPDFECEK